MNSFENKELQSHAHFIDDFDSVVRINFWKFDGNKRLVMRGDSFDEIDPHAFAVGREYGVHLSKLEAQSLMDDLWEMGIRPNSGEGNFGQLGATKVHLEDMRRLVWKLMSMEK